MGQITGNNIWAMYQHMLPRMTELVDWGDE
jgi:hypothetical protein